MTAPSTPSTDSEEKPFALTGATLLFALIAVAWGLLIRQLYPHWGSESYYNYGWAIPFFSLYLFYKRYQERPPFKAPESVSKVGIVLVILSLLAIIPFRLLNEVNPFWRVPFLAQGGLAFLATVFAVFAVGGYKPARYYLFPAFFLFTMVPWPYQVEIRIIHSFTQFTAEATVLAVQLIGHPASLVGNIITVGDAHVGVDDACSGIRSLQSLGMIALFMGEYFRMSFKRRIILVGIMLGLVLIFNMIRSTGLTLCVLEGGNELYEKWHDPLGTITFIASVVTLYLISEFISPKRKEPDATIKRAPFTTRPSPIFLSLIAAVIILPEISVAGWFHYKESQFAESTDWTIQWPEEKEGSLEFKEISEKVGEILHYDYGQRARVQLTPEVWSEIYFYGYTGENRMASVSSYGHAPTICMEAAGARLERELEPLTLDFGEFRLPLKHYLFSSSQKSGGYPIQIFWCIWERRNMGVEAEELADLRRLHMVEMLLKGRRDYGRKVLLMAIPGDHDFGSMRVIAGQFLRKHIQKIEAE